MAAVHGENDNGELTLCTNTSKFGKDGSER